MTKVITITNHKGGVGKTAITANVANYMLAYLKNILVIDMDPQANVTDLLCSRPDNVVPKVSDLLRFAVWENVDFKKANEKLDVFNDMFSKATVDSFYDDKRLSILTSSLELTRTKIELSSKESIANFKIKEMIRHLTKGYEFVLIDTPPSIELLTFASIAAADYIIIPIQLDAHAIKGALDIINDILPIVIRYYNPRCRIIGIVVNLHEGKTRMSKVTAKKVTEIFGDYLFKTKISRSVRVGELSIMKTTLNKISSGSKSELEFISLTEEIYGRIQAMDAMKNDNNE